MPETESFRPSLTHRASMSLSGGWAGLTFAFAQYFVHGSSTAG